MDQNEVFRYARRLAEQRTKENEARDEAARAAQKQSRKGRVPLWKQLTGRR
jgi:Arc/MetJ-type ribon-helix-helix transcriptional regulator